jgi:hypothetical protein
MQNVRARHQASIPRGAQGGMGVMRAGVGRKRGHMPLRKLMKIAGDTDQKIKPVFLMSPVSVAQFLPPGSVDFDLLVIDEASQLRPEDALGLIARCRRSSWARRGASGRRRRRAAATASGVPARNG